MKQLFYAYSAADARQRDRLEQHLQALKQRGVLSGWHSRVVGAGADGRDGVSAHASQADIFLLLVSSDLLTDSYFHGPEVRLALERHRRGEAKVIPVLVRPCSWNHTTIGSLAPLPANGKPVTRWSNADEAFRSIAAGIAAAATPPAPAVSAPAESPAEVPAEGAAPAAAAAATAPARAAQGASAGAATAVVERPAAAAPAAEPVPAEIMLQPHELGPGFTSLDPSGSRPDAGSAKVISVAGVIGGEGGASFQVAQLVFRAKTTGDAAVRLEAGVQAELTRGGQTEPVAEVWDPQATVRRVRLVGRKEPGAMVLAAKDRFLVAAKVSGGKSGAEADSTSDPAGLAGSVVRRMLARIPAGVATPSAPTPRPTPTPAPAPTPARAPVPEGAAR
jgi:hypothetical protein